jgi:hypothetical protein
MPGSKMSLVDRTPKEGPPWISEGRGFIDGVTTLSDAEIAWKLHQELNQTRSRRFQEGGSLDKHPSVMTSNGNSSAWHSSDNEKNDNIVKPDSDNDDEVLIRKTSSRKGKPESHATSKLVPKTNEQKRKQPPKPPKPIKIPKLPMVKQGNKWYRARVVQETTTSAQFEFAGYEAVMPMIWLPRNSDRIWFGSYKGKDWRYLGGGAWEPKNKVKNRVPQTNLIIATNGCEGQGDQYPVAAQKRAAAAEAMMDHFDHKLHPLTDSPDERVPLSSKHHETKSEENGENDLALEVVMGSKRKKVCLANGNSKSNGHAHGNGVGLENGRRVRERVEARDRDGTGAGGGGGGGDKCVADNAVQLRPKRSSKRNTQIYNDEEFALEGDILDAVGDPPHPGWYYVVPEGDDGGTLNNGHPSQGNPVGEREKKEPKGNEVEQLQMTEPAPVHSLQKKVVIGPNSDPGRRRRKPVVSSPAPTDVDRFFDPQQQNKASVLQIKRIGIDEEEPSLIENVPSCPNDHPDASQPAAIKSSHQPHVPSSKTVVHGNGNGSNGSNGMKNRAMYPLKPGRPRKADRILHQQRALNRSFSQPGSGAWGGGVRKPGGEYFRRAASMDSLLTAGKRFGKLLGAVAERLGHLTTNCPANKDGTASPGAAWSQHTWVGTDANGSPPAILNVPMELFRLPIPTCTPAEIAAEVPADHSEQAERPEGKKENEESPKEGGNDGGGGVVGTTNQKPPVPLFC